MSTLTSLRNLITNLTLPRHFAGKHLVVVGLHPGGSVLHVVGHAELLGLQNAQGPRAGRFVNPMLERISAVVAIFFLNFDGGRK